MPTLNDYLLVSGLLFAIGLAGVVLRRNIIVVFMCLELMLSAANLSLVAFSRFNTVAGLPDYNGQMLVLFVIMLLNNHVEEAPEHSYSIQRWLGALSVAILGAGACLAVSRSQALVDLIIEHTHTCYLGDREHRHAWGYGCGSCPACELRAKGYAGFSANLNRASLPGA